LPKITAKASIATNKIERITTLLESNALKLLLVLSEFCIGVTCRGTRKSVSGEI
jgi:hypothetical protein